MDFLLISDTIHTGDGPHWLRAIGRLNDPHIFMAAEPQHAAFIPGALMPYDSRPASALARVKAWRMFLRAHADKQPVFVIDGEAQCRLPLLAARSLMRSYLTFTVRAPQQAPPLLRYLYRHAVRKACLSRHTAEGLRAAGDSAVVVPPLKLPIDTPDNRRLTRLKRRVQLRKADRVLLAIGPLDPKSGHATVLKAVHHLLKKQSQAKLLVVGDGPDMAYLQALAASLAIAGRVFFLGAAEPWPELFALAEVVVCASDDGRPAPWRLAALQVGVPLVATTNPEDTPPVPADTHALWQNTPNAESLAGTLAELLSDDDRRSAMAAAARQYASARFAEPQSWLARLLG